MKNIFFSFVKELKFLQNKVLTYCEPIVNSCFSELYERIDRFKNNNWQKIHFLQKIKVRMALRTAKRFFLHVSRLQAEDMARRCACAKLHKLRKINPHYTRCFKYDRDCLHLFTHKSVPVIFEPPCIKCLANV